MNASASDYVNSNLVQLSSNYNTFGEVLETNKLIDMPISRQLWNMKV